MDFTQVLVLIRDEISELELDYSQLCQEYNRNDIQKTDLVEKGIVHAINENCIRRHTLKKFDRLLRQKAGYETT